MKTRHLLLIAYVVLFFGRSVAAEPAQKPPPLVLEPNKYAYTFGVPEGWEFSFEQARNFGVPLVFFPGGGNFHESNTVIYVNEVCRAKCIESLDTIIEGIVSNARNNSPNLKVATVQPLKIREGGSAPVRILTGSRDPRQAKEALAFIKHTEVVVLVVLTTKDTKSWDSDYKAFEEIVGGHRFFNCDTPDLAVPCR
jgi:hypothetical protein